MLYLVPSPASLLRRKCKVETFLFGSLSHAGKLYLGPLQSADAGEPYHKYEIIIYKQSIQVPVQLVCIKKDNILKEALEYKSVAGIIVRANVLENESTPYHSYHTSHLSLKSN